MNFYTSDNPRGLVSETLDPSSLLAFRALHPLEHSSVIKNKQTSANRFITYKHTQNIHPSFKYSRSKDLAVSYLRNLKCLSQAIWSSYFSSCQGKDLWLALSTCTACKQKTVPSCCNQGHLSVPIAWMYLL